LRRRGTFRKREEKAVDAAAAEPAGSLRDRASNVMT